MSSNFGDNMNQLAGAIEKLSQYLKTLSSADGEESERLEKYRENLTLLEFTFVTGGLIEGIIQWTDKQSIGIKTKSGQNIILYKHAIAFVQERS